MSEELFAKEIKNWPVIWIMCKAQTYPDLTPKDDMPAPPPICMPIPLPQQAQAMPPSQMAQAMSPPQMAQAMPPPQMAQAMPPQQMAQAVPLQLQLTPMVNTVQEAKFGTIGGKANMKDAGPTFVLLQPGTNLTAVSCNSQFSQVVQCPNCRQTVNTTTRTRRLDSLIHPVTLFFTIFSRLFVNRLDQYEYIRIVPAVPIIGRSTWIVAGVMCCLGMWCCAPCVFCFDGAKDIVHTCPMCSTQIGTRVI